MVDHGGPGRGRRRRASCSSRPPWPPCSPWRWSSSSSSDAPANDRGAAAVVHALMVALPAAVALAALARNAHDRFARALLVIALLWSATALAEASDATLYSLGRVAAWLVEPTIVFLLLAFPSGRLATPAARRLVVAATLLILVLFVPTALVVDAYPVPTPWSATCDTDCPANALQVTSSQPAIVDGLIRPVREVLAALLRPRGHRRPRAAGAELGAAPARRPRARDPPGGVQDGRAGRVRPRPGHRPRQPGARRRGMAVPPDPALPGAGLRGRPRRAPDLTRRGPSSGSRSASARRRRRSSCAAG